MAEKREVGGLAPYTPITGTDEEITELLRQAGFGSEEVPDWVDEEQEREEEEEGYGAWEHAGRKFVEGTGGMLGSLPEGVGIGWAWLSGQTPSDTWLGQFGGWVKEGTRMELVDPKYSGSFLASDLPQGLGSVLGFALSGAGLGKLGAKGMSYLPAKVAARTAAIETAVIAGTPALTRTGVSAQYLKALKAPINPSAATLSGATLSKKAIERITLNAANKFKQVEQAKAGRIAVGFAGAQVQGAEGYHDAINTMLQKARLEGREHLTNDELDTAFKAYWYNYPGGLIEMYGIEGGAAARLARGKLGVGVPSNAEISKWGRARAGAKDRYALQMQKLHQNLDVVTKGKFSRGLSRPLQWGLTTVGKPVLREALQESTQSAWLNYTANSIVKYDENRSLWEGVVRSGEVGGAIGFIFGMVGMAMGVKGRRMKRIEELTDREGKLREAGQDEAADTIAAELESLKVEHAKDMDTGPAAENETDQDLNERDRAYAAVATAEGEAAAETFDPTLKEVTPAEEPAEEPADPEGWGEGRLETGAKAPTPEQIQRAVDLNLLSSEITGTKKKKLINTNNLEAALKRKKLAVDFEAENTETRTDDEVTASVEGLATYIEVVQRKRPKGLAVTDMPNLSQVVAKDKDGNEVAALSPLMDKKEAGAFAFGAVQPAFSHLGVRLTPKGKAHVFKSTYAKKILGEKEGISDKRIPEERKAFADRFRDRSKTFQEQEFRTSDEPTPTPKKAATKKEVAPKKKAATKKAATKKKAAAKEKAEPTLTAKEAAQQMSKQDYVEWYNKQGFEAGVTAELSWDSQQGAATTAPAEVAPAEAAEPEPVVGGETVTMTGGEANALVRKGEYRVLSKEGANAIVEWRGKTWKQVPASKDGKVVVQLTEVEAPGVGIQRAMATTEGARFLGGLDTSKPVGGTHKSSNLESLEENGFGQREFRGIPVGVSIARTDAEELSSPTLAEPAGSAGVVDVIVRGKGVDYTTAAGKKLVDDLHAESRKKSEAAMAAGAAPGTRETMVSAIPKLLELGYDWVNGWNSIGADNELHVINPAVIEIVGTPRAAPEAAPEAAPAAEADPLEAGVAELKAAMKDNAKRANIGGLPSGRLMTAGFTVGSLLLQKGARSFAAWAKAMVDAVGEGIKPHLRAIYENLRYTSGVTGQEEMTSAAELDQAVGEGTAADAILESIVGEPVAEPAPAAKPAPAKKKVTKKSVSEGAAATRKKKAGKVKKATGTTNKKSATEVVTGKEPDKNDVMDTLGVQPTIVKEEAEDEAVVAVNAGPYPNKGLATAAKNRFIRKNPNYTVEIVPTKDGKFALYSRNDGPVIITEGNLSQLDINLKKAQKTHEYDPTADAEAITQRDISTAESVRDKALEAEQAARARRKKGDAAAAREHAATAKRASKRIEELNLSLEETRRANAELAALGLPPVTWKRIEVVPEPGAGGVTRGVAPMVKSEDELRRGTEEERIIMAKIGRHGRTYNDPNGERVHVPATGLRFQLQRAKDREDKIKENEIQDAIEEQFAKLRLIETTTQLQGGAEGFNAATGTYETSGKHEFVLERKDISRIQNPAEGIVGVTFDEDLTPEAVARRVSAENAEGLAKDVAADVDGMFEKWAKKIGFILSGHPDGMELETHGLTTVLKARLVQLISTGGAFEGLPVHNIQFKTGKPMFVQGETGRDDNTIYVSPLRLAETLERREMVDGKWVPSVTLDELLYHELEHIVINRAILYGHVKRANKDGVITDMTGPDINQVYTNIFNKNIKVAESLLAAGDSSLFNAYRNFIAQYFNQDIADRLVWNPDLQREGAPYKGMIENTDQFQKATGGAEWIRFLLGEMGKHARGVETIKPSGYQVVHHSTKNVLTYLSHLTRFDLGIDEDGSIPLAIENIIQHAFMLVSKTNAFSQRALYLDDMGVLDRLTGAFENLEGIKLGEKTTERIRDSEYLILTWESMVEEAAALGEALDALSGLKYPKGYGQVWVDGKQVTLSVRKDWHTDHGPMVIKGGRKNSKTIKQIVDTYGNSRKDLMRNNPHLAELIRDEGETDTGGHRTIPTEARILIAPLSEKQRAAGRKVTVKTEGRRFTQTRGWESATKTITKNYPTYDEGAAEIRWWRRSTEKAGKKKHADEDKRLISLEWIYNTLAGHGDNNTLPTQYDEIGIDSSEAGELAAEPTDQSLHFLGGQPDTADPSAQMEASHDNAAKLTLNDKLSLLLQTEVDISKPSAILTEEQITQRIGEEKEVSHFKPFELIEELGFGLSPMDVVMYIWKATALGSDNVTIAGELQGYHNGNVRKFEAIEEARDKARVDLNRLKRVRKDKRGDAWAVDVAQAEVNLREAAERQANFQRKFFGDLKPTRIKLIEVEGEGRKKKVTALVDLAALRPALQAAFNASGRTPEELRAMWDTDMQDNDAALFPLQIGFPTTHVLTPEMEMVVSEAFGTVKRDNWTFEGTTDPQFKELSSRVMKHLLYGDMNGSGIIPPVQEIIDRIESIREDWDNGTLQAELGIPPAGLVAGSTGLIKALRVVRNQHTDKDGVIDERVRTLLNGFENWAKELAGAPSSQAGSTLRSKRMQNEELADVIIRDGYRRSVEKKQKDTFGRIIDLEWVDWLSKTIDRASDIAANALALASASNIAEALISTNSVRDAAGGTVSEGVIWKALSDTMRTLGRKKMLLKRDFEAEFRRQLEAATDPVTGLPASLELDLKPEEMRTLASSIISTFKAQRIAELQKLFKTTGGGKVGGRITMNVLGNSAGAILNLRDTGSIWMENTDTRIVDGEQFNTSVLSVWDAVSPAVFGTKNGWVGDPVDMKLMEMELEIEARGLKGVRAAAIREKMLLYVMENTEIDPLALLRDAWFAGALSGLRTFVDIGTGSVMHGAVSTALLAADVAVRNTGSSRSDGLRMISNYVSGLLEGWDGFLHILKTGDLSKLPDANERLLGQLTKQEEFYGGQSLEAKALQVSKEKGRYGWKAYAGSMKYVRRLVLGLDYVGATGGRRAMLLYAASTRRVKASEAAKNATTEKERKELEARVKRLDKAYAAAVNMSDKALRAKAMVDATEDVHGPDADPKKYAKDRLVVARAREIMEADIELADGGDILMTSSEIGRVFALNAEPVGLGGVIHKMMQGSGILKYGLGFAFSRAAMNMASNASNFVPFLGAINAVRTLPWVGMHMSGVKAFRPLDISVSKDWHKNMREGKQVMSEERAQIIRLQGILSTSLLLGLLAYFDDDDDDFDMIGSLNGVSYEKKQQLLSQGIKPYSIKWGNHYIGFKNTPLAGWLTGLGNMRDGKKWGKWDEKTSGDRFLNATLGGLGYIADVGVASQFTTLIGSLNRSADVEDFGKRMLTGFFQGTVGTVTSPNILREVDTWFDPTYHKPGKHQFWAHAYSQMVFVPGLDLGYGILSTAPRRQSKPMLNALGEEVEVMRAPWSRWYKGVADPTLKHPSNDRVWNLMGKWAKESVWLPLGGDGKRIVGEDLVVREMTPEEAYEYKAEVGRELRKALEKRIEILEEVTPKQARRYLDKTSANIKKRVALDISRKARSR